MVRAGARVAVLLPAEESFSPNGGAVALWVREVYRLPTTFKVSILCPRHDKSWRDENRVSRFRLYRMLDRALETLASVLALVVPRPRESLVHRLRLRGLLFVIAAWPTVRRADVVHLHNRPGYAIWLRRLGYRGLLVLHMHNEVANYLRPRDVAGLRNAVDHFVFCSRYIERSARIMLGDVSSTVVYNGVTRGARPRSGRREMLLLLAGRMIPEKGIHLAIAACAELRERGYPYRLEICGPQPARHSANGAYFAHCLSLATAVNSRFQSQVIHLSGHLPHSDLIVRMQRARYLIHPCQWAEPFGMVLVEAMSVGTPVVASKVGGIPEIVTPAALSDCLVEEFTQPSRFAEAILSMDRVDYEHISVTSFEATEPFDWVHIRDAWLDVLEQVQRESPNRSGERGGLST
jgi:lipopolysaccharide exporter